MRTFQEEWKDIKHFWGSKAHQNELIQAKDILSRTPIILYGAGIEGVEFAKVLKHCSIQPLCFCDKHKTGNDSATALPIISPKSLMEEKYSKSNILISSSLYNTEIENDLQQLGIESNRILSRGLWFRLCLSAASNPHLQKDLSHSQYLLMFNAISKMAQGEDSTLLAGYERAYNLLADFKSKKVLIDRLKFCLLGTLIERDPLASMYFDLELVKLSDNEVFVDCGMFTADTAEVFFKRANNNYTHYYGFEPDINNVEKANHFLADRTNATTVAKGLWSCETKLSFSDGQASCSNVNEVGEHFIELVSIDDYFADSPHTPTFIKMDIEGSELEAICGAKNIISTHKPRLAISVYHKPEDIYTILEAIKSFRDDYVFYFRHYTDVICETVLYAI